MTDSLDSDLGEKFKSIQQHEDNLKKLNLSYDDLLRITAYSFADNELSDFQIVEMNGLLDEYEKVLSVFKLMAEKNSHELGNTLLELFAEQNNQVAKALIHGAKFQRVSQARKAALTKLKNDPKQLALKEIKLHYHENKKQFKRRGYTAQFIREMHAKYPIIESQKTIENLVSVLNRENDDIPH